MGGEGVVVLARMFRENLTAKWLLSRAGGGEELTVAITSAGPPSMSNDYFISVSCHLTFLNLSL